MDSEELQRIKSPEDIGNEIIIFFKYYFAGLKMIVGLTRNIGVTIATSQQLSPVAQRN